MNLFIRINLFYFFGHMFIRIIDSLLVHFVPISYSYLEKNITDAQKHIF